VQNTLDQNLPPVRRNIVARFFTEMPIIFPLIALFHLGLTIFEALNYIGDDSVSRIYWLRPLVLLVYTFCWGAVCFTRKWGAMGYLVLTLINVSFNLFGPDILLRRALGDLLFAPIPINLLFAFLLLFYFRKMK
jgi:hypothetical protein